MTEKRFKVEKNIFDGYCIADNTIDGYYAYDKQDLERLCDSLNELNDENKQLKYDATVLIQANQDYRRENHKIKSLLLKKIKNLNNDYQQLAKNGMPTGGIIGELDSFEEICEIMGWEDD